MLQNGLDVALGRAKADPRRSLSVGGAWSTPSSSRPERSTAAPGSSASPARPVRISANGCQNELVGNGQMNIRVNQDCSLRQQAGESIAIDPATRTGCSSRRTTRASASITAVSTGRRRRAPVGRLHAALLPVPAARRPYGRLLRRSDGDLGLAGQRVHRRRFSSRRRSPTQRPPSSSRSPTPALAAPSSTRPILEGGYQEYRALPLGVVANVNDPELSRTTSPSITADTSPSSPKRDNIYVTWTLFGPEIEKPQGTGRDPRHQPDLPQPDRPTAAPPGPPESRSAASTTASAAPSSATMTRALSPWSAPTGRSTSRL